MKWKDKAKYYAVIRKEHNISKYYCINTHGFDFKDIFGSVIPFLDIQVGTACNLRCKYCNTKIPEMKKLQIFTAKEVIRSLEILLNGIDKLLCASLLGGEPFLNQELGEIIDFLDKQTKVERIVIVTNGTIMPNMQILKAMAKSSKLVISFSNYCLKDYNAKNKLISYCKIKHIRYKLNEEQTSWEDMGRAIKRNYSIPQLKESFEHCYCNMCPGLYKGKLYRCGITWIMEELGIYRANEEEFISLADIKNRREFKKVLDRFYSVPYLETCAYCKHSDRRSRIKPGEQMEE